MKERAIRQIVYFTIVTLIVQLNTGCPKTPSSSQTINADSNTCDTLITIALELIQQDSQEVILPESDRVIPLYATKFNFTSYDIGEDGQLKPEGIPFQREVHDSLELRGIWESERLDTIFSEKDIERFYQRNTPISKDCFPVYNFISNDSIRKRLDSYSEGNSTFKSHTYYTISRPLLSQSKEYMLLEFDHHCFGLCGSGHTYLFKKTDQQWTTV